MVVAVQIDIYGATLDQYDQVNELIGLLPGGPAPSRDLFHWVTKTDVGIRVVDVWETREAFEAFERAMLSPALQEVGIQEPEVQIFEVHNYFFGGRPRT